MNIESILKIYYLLFRRKSVKKVGRDWETSTNTLLSSGVFMARGRRGFPHPFREFSQDYKFTITSIMLYVHIIFKLA